MRSDRSSQSHCNYHSLKFSFECRKKNDDIGSDGPILSLHPAKSGATVPIGRIGKASLKLMVILRLSSKREYRGKYREKEGRCSLRWPPQPFGAARGSTPRPSMGPLPPPDSRALPLRRNLPSGISGSLPTRQRCFHHASCRSTAHSGSSRASHAADDDAPRPAPSGALPDGRVYERRAAACAL